MLVKAPTTEAELTRLIDDTVADSRSAIEGAIREAYHLGWGDHGAAVADATAKLDNPPDISTPETPEHFAHIMASAVGPAVQPRPSAEPAPDTQMAMILDIVKVRP